MRIFILAFLMISTPGLAQLSADFSVVNTQGCIPFTVQFQDKSTGSPTQWFWDFGNGTFSFLQNPTAVYTSKGSYKVRLIVRNSTEETYKEVANFINAFATPNVNFSIAGNTAGCLPFPAAFKDSSDLFNATVQSWLWNFGDGNTSNQQNPVYTYNTSGKFDVSLTVTTTEGCSASYTMLNAVSAGNKPVADFSAAPTDGCASAIRKFKNQSSGNISTSTWYFGDGGTSMETSPGYHYKDTGTFTVKLVVSENGCQDSTEKIDYIHAEGPVARIAKTVDCANRYTVSFRDISIGGKGRLWDFGDGNTSTSRVVTHTYALPGVYFVVLTSDGTNCKDTAYDTLYIDTQNPEIQISSVKDVYCRNDSMLFFVTGHDSIVSKSYAWNFDDGTITDFGRSRDSVYYIYRTNGNYQPALYIKDYVNCIDTFLLNGTAQINGPFAAFQISPKGCTGSPVNFIDQSVANSGIAITEWSWSFGDGFGTNLPGPLTHTYAFPVIYNAQLIVTDAKGCRDTMINPVDVDSTPVVIIDGNTFACSGSNISLNATGADTYVWQNNPDLNCTNCSNPVATPLQAATYYVTGTTSDGCPASDTINISVQLKEFVSVQPQDTTVCQKSSVQLNATGTYSYQWSPSGTLNNPDIANPLATPLSNTVYTVTGRDSNNCFTDTATVTISVNPLPAVNITDSVVQVLIGSTYTINATTGIDAQSIEWSPLTGLSCYNCLQPVATITNSITYTLKATNGFGCVNTDQISIISVCTGESVYIPNTFSPNNDGMNDYFFPRAAGDLIIKSLTIFNRWGQMVFQKQNLSANNFNDGWDGKYKNVLQNSDAYIYMMELRCADNTVFVKKGSITLLR